MRIHEEVRKMPVSPIRTWTSRLHDLSPRAELTLGEPPQITDSRIIEAAKTALDQGLTHYPPAAGLQSLRQELAKRERQLRGWTIPSPSSAGHRRSAGSTGRLLPGIAEPWGRGFNQ